MSHRIAIEVAPGMLEVETVHRAGVWAVHKVQGTVNGHTVTHLPTGNRCAELWKDLALKLCDDLQARFPSWGLDLPWGTAVDPNTSEARPLFELVEHAIAIDRTR